MHPYDDATVKTAAEAYCEALSHVEGTRSGVPITQEAANLAVAIGVTTSAALGATSRARMVLSALSHMAVAYREHSDGVDTQSFPSIRNAKYYLAHADELCAMAECLRDEHRDALKRHAEVFEDVARSRKLVAASLLQLCKAADRKILGGSP